MSRATWHKQIASKFFQVYYYRKLATFLIMINIINLGLLVAIGLIFIGRGEASYYATNGYMPPVLIYAMNTANEAETPLLPPDQVELIKPKTSVQ